MHLMNILNQLNASEDERLQVKNTLRIKQFLSRE